MDLNNSLNNKLNILTDFINLIDDVLVNDVFKDIPNYKLYQMYYSFKSVKMCRIVGECNALDISEDKVNNNKQFLCFWPKCQFSAYNRFDLSKHRLIHLNERPFICSITDSRKRFKTKQNLIRHKLIHSNEKPFKCANCDYVSGR